MIYKHKYVTTYVTFFLTKMETMQWSPKLIQVILWAMLTPVGSKFWHISEEDMFMCFPQGKKLLQTSKEM